MKIKNNNFYIITGGPSSGKSTIIDALKKKGFLCVDEVARVIIKEQLENGGDALHTKNQIKFRDLMLSRSIDTYNQVLEREKPIFFDRGIPELIGYCRLINSEVPDSMRLATNLYRYNKKVFTMPPWEEIYVHDEERKQSWKEAVRTYQVIADAYRESGYELIEVPKATIEERITYILTHLEN